MITKWEVVNPSIETLVALSRLGVTVVTGEIVLSIDVDDPELIVKIEQLFAEKGLVLVRV